MDTPRRFEADPEKDVRNVSLRGLSLLAAADFDFEGAVVRIDDRFDYGEERRVAIGMIGPVPTFLSSRCVATPAG